VVRLSPDKILNPDAVSLYGGIGAGGPVLVILAAGKGTRFGRDPKCIQPVHGTPLARHSIDAFRRVSASPVIALVGYRHIEVSRALGDDNIYVRSDNPAGGTAFAALEAFSTPGLLDANPLLIITMGDRIVPPSVFRRLIETHQAGGREAGVTFLSAVYEPPKNRGKGRVLRGENGRVIRILEERDILAQPEGPDRERLLGVTEGNCPLYVIRAATLHRHLVQLDNNNAQGQFYLTDIVQNIGREGGDIRTVTTTVSDAEYDLLCSDVTQPMDLALLEGILASSRGLLFPEEVEVEEAARAIAAGRPPAQIASIARQLRELAEGASRENLAFRPDQPAGIGISGGRLRIAFMHPDMGRFFGPAWQMPIGAGEASGSEQIIVLAQTADDGRIHLFPMNPKFRESVNFIPSDTEVMYPGEEISDLHTYEGFGTRMSERLLLSLGYFSDAELDQRRRAALPLPPPWLWVANSMRRPFALVGNAIASMRTLRAGNLGAKVHQVLGRENFRGLRLVSTGAIPEGGFSSSSAVTVATKNALNALYDIGIPPDVLVHLACQAEYGTGVRAGSLDQATEQKGRSGQGTLISSNPRENYRIIGTYPVPTEHLQILFPYSVERDRNAWRWSWGMYSESVVPEGPLTTGETRKMTGKAAEIAAVLTRLPHDTDFFKLVEDELVTQGELSLEKRRGVAAILRQLPLRASQQSLRERVMAQRDWYAGQLMESQGLDLAAARQKAEASLEALFAGWRAPEGGVPLRAMVAYLFGEVAKNFRLIHDPDRWIEYVSLSQRGDKCFEIDPSRLPPKEDMTRELEWERGASGPARLNLWLERLEAKPFDYDEGIRDGDLDAPEPPLFHRLRGSNFFRGLALIDLAEAMLVRAFAADAVAVRVNAAGQGDFFQVHVDRRKASPAEVKEFLRAAFYRRFGLSPSPEFVEIHAGGGATGVRLSRYDMLPQLIRRIESMVGAA